MPLSAADIAADASEVMRAGASSVHVHVRDSAGAETLDPVHCAAVARAVRKRCPGLAFGFSTGEWIVRELERRLDLISSWIEIPDFCSVNVTEQGWQRVWDVLARRGISVEAGVSSRDDAERLIASGRGALAMRVLVETPDMPAGKAVALSTELERRLSAAVPAVKQLHHGTRSSTWAVIESALRRRLATRVGLEDTITLPDGAPARDNLQLLEVAREWTTTP